jgi:hypothetical protein
MEQAGRRKKGRKEKKEEKKGKEGGKQALTSILAFNFVGCRP